MENDIFRKHMEQMENPVKKEMPENGDTIFVLRYDKIGLKEKIKQFFRKKR